MSTPARLRESFGHRKIQVVHGRASRAAPRRGERAAVAEGRAQTAADAQSQARPPSFALRMQVEAWLLHSACTVDGIDAHQRAELQMKASRPPRHHAWWRDVDAGRACLRGPLRERRDPTTCAIRQTRSLMRIARSTAKFRAVLLLLSASRNTRASKLLGCGRSTARLLILRRTARGGGAQFHLVDALKPVCTRNAGSAALQSARLKQRCTSAGTAAGARGAASTQQGACLACGS